MSIDLEQLQLIVSKTVQQALAQEKQIPNNKVTNKRKNDDFSSPSHALVFWIDEKKYSIVPYKSIDLDVDSVADINKVYDIAFNSKVYKGKIILIGPKQDCEKHCSNIRSESQNETITEIIPVQKMQKKVNIKDSSDHQLRNQNIELKDEIEVLKNKLMEYLNLNKSNVDEISILKKELETQKEKMNSIMNTYC